MIKSGLISEFLERRANDRNGWKRGHCLTVATWRTTVQCGLKAGPAEREVERRLQRYIQRVVIGWLPVEIDGLGR
jgi:hypothetical protein